VYAAAVASAGTGQGLAIAAAVVAGVGLGLQITATVLYADLNSRTSTTPAPAAATTNVSAARLSELKLAYQTSNATAQTAYNATNPAPTQSIDDFKNLQLDKSAAVTTALNGVVAQDSILGNLLKDTFTGKSETCALADTAACSSAGYTLRGVNTPANNIVANYSKNLLTAPYSPGVVSALSGYYQAVAQAGANASSGPAIPPSNPPSTNPDILAAEAARAAAAAALAAAPVTDPATALSSSNAVISSYNSLLAATADFDLKNLALANDSLHTDTNALTAARDVSLATLRTQMGNPSWTYTGTTSLCGGGAVSTCGWMTNTSSGTASTASTTVNDYLTAYANYENRVGYQKSVDAATGKANIAWTDRNGYKTALCGNAAIPVMWLGGSALPSANPSNWDTSENLIAASPTGLSCTGSATAINLSTDTAAANAAEIKKYCVTPATLNPYLCGLYSATLPARSAIQGAKPIVDALIFKGIVK
jgi:hypothetical protein